MLHAGHHEYDQYGKHGGRGVEDVGDQHLPEDMPPAHHPSDAVVPSFRRPVGQERDDPQRPPGLDLGAPRLKRVSVGCSGTRDVMHGLHARPTAETPPPGHDGAKHSRRGRRTGRLRRRVLVYRAIDFLSTHIPDEPGPGDECLLLVHTRQVVGQVRYRICTDCARVSSPRSSSTSASTAPAWAPRAVTPTLPPSGTDLAQHAAQAHHP